MTPLPTTYRKLIGSRFTRNFREAAQIVDEELRLPAKNEVLVRHLYAGVNASDINMTSGMYIAAQALPYDLGIETASEVVAVGAGVEHLAVGEPVLTFSLGGGYREYLTIDAGAVYPVPEATPETVALICSGLTASIGLEITGQMKSEEEVLVTAACGGTGHFAVGPVTSRRMRLRAAQGQASTSSRKTRRNNEAPSMRVYGGGPTPAPRLVRGVGAAPVGGGAGAARARAATLAREAYEELRPTRRAHDRQTAMREHATRKVPAKLLPPRRSAASLCRVFSRLVIFLDGIRREPGILAHGSLGRRACGGAALVL